MVFLFNNKNYVLATVDNCFEKGSGFKNTVAGSSHEKEVVTRCVSY